MRMGMSTRISTMLTYPTPSLSAIASATMLKGEF